jgi:site-specific DNA recombinase
MGSPGPGGQHGRGGWLVVVRAENKVLCGYLRLTVDRDGKKIGYDVQKKAILRWAEAYGYTIGAWYQDKDVTAADRTVTRDDYERMLADVEAGTWGGIAVWRLDRLVRLVYEFERCYRLIEDTGGFIVSIEPMISSKDDIGKMLMRLLVMFAEMEISTMKARAKGHRQERALLGKYNGGGPRPYGFVGAERDDKGHYLNTGKVGVDHVPEEVALLREAARLIVDDEKDWAGVIRDWSTRTPPVVGSKGAPMAASTLQRILTGPRAVGMREVFIEDAETGERESRLVDAEWEPIVDQATWEELLKRLPEGDGAYGPKHKYLLSGLLLCGRCSKYLTGSKRKYIKGGEMVSTLTYRCKSSAADKSRGSCGKLSVLAEPVEQIVVAQVLTRLKATRGVVEGVANSPDDSTELEALVDEVDRCDKELVKLIKRHASAEITEPEWLAARDVYAELRSAASLRAGSISRRLGVPLPSGDDLKDLLGWFQGLRPAQQRKLLHLHVRQAAVLPTGRSGPHFNANRVTVTFADAK